MTRPGPLGIALIVAVYTAVFCVALPVGLWLAAVPIDRALPVAIGPTWLGALPAAWGASLQFGGMWALWRRGQGWPISALPPPRLVTGGPYLVCRHPIYAGFNLLVLGVGLMVGSLGLAAVVAPLFAPVWVAYAILEERGLERRFGAEYRRYKRRVGLIPRADLRPLLALFAALRILRVRVEGAHHIPSEGPAVLVGNHTHYADPVWLALTTGRRVWMVSTAEAYRSGGWIQWLTRRWPAFPVRRYRPDARAARRLIELLGAGELVGMFTERERSVLGVYAGTEPRVAAGLPRLGVPVVPVAIQGAYAAGPRWAGTLRFPTLRVRVGPPVDFGTGAPHEVVDRAIRALLDEDPQRVWLERQPLDRLYRAVWRCPACLDEAGWRPAALACDACGARWTPSGDGRIRGADGSIRTFADWAGAVWKAPETLPLEVPVEVWREPAVWGPVGPLVSDGPATLRIDATGLRWADHHVALRDILSTSTERADTLQVATSDAMWQFRWATGSPFRLRLALDALRTERPAHRRAPPPAPAPSPRAARLPTAGAAVGLGLAIVEGLVMLLPLSRGNGAAGLGLEVGPMIAAYVAAGAVIELVVRRLGGGAAAVGLVTTAVFAAIGLATQLPPGAVALVAGGGLWAWAAHHPAWWRAALVVALWGLSPMLPRPSPAPARLPEGSRTGPTVVLVVLDSMRADRTSLERPDAGTTPHLAALADRGTWFRRAYSTSCWSLPAHASMLTGLLPTEHGAHDEHLSLPSDVPILTEQLREAGYETAAFSANSLVAPGTGLGRGFVTFEQHWRSTVVREVMLGWRAWHRFAAPSRDKGGARVVADIDRWWSSRDTSRPAFVLVNLFEAHAPHQEVPGAIRSRFVAGTGPELEAAGERAHMAQVFGVDVPEADRPTIDGLVDGATAAADAYLGEIVAILGDEVVWLVLSDHGELFGESEGLWGHNLGLYEPLIRVPLVVAGPGIRPQRVDAPVSVVDLAPTVRALVGLPAQPSSGRDLSSVLAGGAADPDRTVRAEHLRTDYLTGGWMALHPFADHSRIRARRAAILQGQQKRMRTEVGDDFGYDLGLDPGETSPFPGERTGLPLDLPDPDRAPGATR